MVELESRTTRDRLLEAARRLFLEKGYEAVSIRDITEAADANVASINYHFGGKENLYREVFRLMLVGRVSKMLESLNKAIAEKSPPDLRKVWRTYIESYLGEFLTSKDAQNFVKLVSNEMAEDGLATDILLKEAAEPIHRVLKGAILAARPDMPDIKASLIISSVFGQMFHFVRARHLIIKTTGRDYNTKFINEIMEHILEFSLRGMGYKKR